MKEKGEKRFLSVSTVTIEPAIIVSICICFEKSNKPNFTWDKACCMMCMYSVSGKAVRKYCREERHRRAWTKIRISKCLLEQRSFGGLENSCFPFGGNLVWQDGVAQGLCVFTWHLGKVKEVNTQLQTYNRAWRLSGRNLSLLFLPENPEICKNQMWKI